ncbi:MAG TPA: acylphosphatase [Candidatus Ratteibacteria bacterium]|nr:acylphosphatase [Candidatus Ratteibacteria bacterium]
MKRYHLLIGGFVQGVGFRWYCQKIAKKLGLVGWVKNLSDGNVEILVEGEDSTIKEFLSQLKSGYLGRNISNIEIFEEKYCGEFNDFDIKF